MNCDTCKFSELIPEYDPSIGKTFPVTHCKRRKKNIYDYIELNQNNCKLYVKKEKKDGKSR